MFNRITGHHSGGGYNPSKEDLRSYHKLINGDGQVIDGDYAIDCNSPAAMAKGFSYAAHTWKLNTGNIGVAILAMGGKAQTWANPFGGPFAVLQRQVDAYVREVARLAVLYGVSNDRRFILTHAEVQPTLGVTQRNKWDFDYDPRRNHDSRDPILIGDELRQEIRLHMGHTMSVNRDRAPAARKPVLRQGSPDRAAIMELQTLLGLKADGLFGPKTRDAVIRFQKKHNLLPDGIVGALSWGILLK